MSTENPRLNKVRLRTDSAAKQKWTAFADLQSLPTIATCHKGLQHEAVRSGGGLASMAGLLRPFDLFRAIGLGAVALGAIAR